MSKRLTVLFLLVAGAALPLALPSSVLAEDEAPQSRERQWGEDRWVPSISFSSGVLVQKMRGNVDSEQFRAGSADPLPLQGYHEGNDLVVVPFIGFSLEVMAPAFEIPTRPRIFLSGEILPTFSATRSLAVDGDPGCIRGPEPGAPCAYEEPPEERRQAFGEEAANGEGSKTNAKISTMAYGASLGVAFPFRIRDRQVRLKPSLSWINYMVETDGIVSDATCDPVDRCTTIWIPDILNPGGLIEIPGYLRLPSSLRGSASKRFNGIGPGLDLEVDTVRSGPLGASLFVGARAYYVLGNREISYDASYIYTEPPFENQAATARWNVELNEWLFRAHVGLRIQWLGSAK